MYKKTISYTDFDGNQRTEDFYFNLTKWETIKLLTTSENFSLEKVVQRLVQRQKVSDIIDVFEDIIKRSYGEKGLDGRGFDKSKEAFERFHQTEAYSELMMDLLSDSRKAADFINAIIPADLAAEIDRIKKEHPDGIKPEEVAAIVDTSDKASPIVAK